jgi:hypothetical protein
VLAKLEVDGLCCLVFKEVHPAVVLSELLSVDLDSAIRCVHTSDCPSGPGLLPIYNELDQHLVFYHRKPHCILLLLLLLLRG